MEVVNFLEIPQTQNVHLELKGKTWDENLSKNDSKNEYKNIERPLSKKKDSLLSGITKNFYLNGHSYDSKTNRVKAENNSLIKELYIKENTERVNQDTNISKKRIQITIILLNANIYLS